jgi:cell fate regulator YaaT (PSP1 superfamily)
MTRIVDIRFKPAGRLYHFSVSSNIELKNGDMAIVEVEKGIGIGRVVVAPRAMEEGKLEHRLKKIVRRADDVDFERDKFNREREKEAFTICKEKIIKYKLQMKLVEVEYLFDSSKAIFYFTSESRVDFRELVKDLAGCFYTRIEMRQIGVRDEAKHVGGLGPCGRELCCSSFLQDFAPVTVKMAKEQNIALNPLKISGVCGRLMCCLGYEIDKNKCAKKGGNKDRGKDNGGGGDGARAGRSGRGRDGGREGREGREVRVDQNRDKPKTDQSQAAECGGCPSTGAESPSEGSDKILTQSQDKAEAPKPQGQGRKRSSRRGRSRGQRRAEKRAQSQSEGQPQSEAKPREQGQLPRDERPRLSDGADRKEDKTIMAKDPTPLVSRPPALPSVREENKGGSTK